MNIYVGNLNYRVKEADLQQVMEDYGKVTSCKVIIDRETGRSKGFGFVEMDDDAAATKAIAELKRNLLPEELVKGFFYVFYVQTAPPIHRRTETAD